MPFKRINSARDRNAQDSAVHMNTDPVRRRMTQAGARVLNWRPTGLRTRPSLRTTDDPQWRNNGERTAADPTQTNNPQLLRRAVREHPGAIDADDVNIAQRAKHAASPKKLPEQSTMYRTPMPIRVAQLTADAIVLTLASPFFAVWWLVRKSRDWLGRS